MIKIPCAIFSFIQKLRRWIPLKKSLCFLKVDSRNEGQMSSPENIGAGLCLKASVKPLFGLGVESRRQKHVQMERVLLQTFFSLKKKATPSRFGNSTQPVWYTVKGAGRKTGRAEARATPMCNFGVLKWKENPSADSSYPKALESVIFFPIIESLSWQETR